MTSKRFLIRLTLPYVTLLACLATLAVGPALADGSISGSVKYEGRVPKLRALKMDADPACASKHSTGVAPELLVLGSGNALQNVFVRVKSGLPSKTYSAPSAPVVMDQTGCMYAPHVLGVMVGQKFVIKNSDGLLHNVHSLSKVNSPFNRAMPGTVMEADYTFSKEEGMFKVKCDVHPWMAAYVGVMTHPFFDVTGSDGKFEIKGLPAGTYEVEAWHEFDKFPAQTQTITIGGDESKTADFTFKGPSN